MTEPRSALGQKAMEAGDHVIEHFGRDAEIGEILIVMDVTAPDEDGEKQNEVTYFSGDTRHWLHEALLVAALVRCEEEQGYDDDEELEGAEEDEEE